MERPPPQEFEVKSCSISNVVVYKDRAEVRRNICLTIPAGESEILVKGLSQSVDGDSIRVEGRGDATILDVIYYTEEKEENKEAITDGEPGEDSAYKMLVESLEEKKRELKILEFRQEIIERQKNTLKVFADHVTSQPKEKKEENDDFQINVQPVSVTAVMEFMSQYQEKMAVFDERLLELSSYTKKLEEEISVMESKKESLSVKEKKETIRAVRVILEANEEVDVVLIVSYVVSNASWSPSYDVRVFTKDKSLKVHYYGLIKQKTGEDWENANITLSTAQPDIGGSAPQLDIRYINIKRKKRLAPIYLKFGSSSAPAVPVRRKASLRADRFSAAYGESSSLQSLEIDVSKVDTSQLYNTSYSIPRTATIPSDNIEHKVTVAMIDLEPDFSYISVPRRSPRAFLQAAVKNTSVYALLDGPANVFLDNNFLAKSSLPNTSPNEEFTSSLGTDDSIRITCQPLSVIRGSTGRINKNNLHTYTFVHSVKNTQANVVKLKVLEQIPVSTDEKLKVSVLQPELKKQNVHVGFSFGYSLLNEDNNIEWHCTLPADTSVDLQLVYSVEFPPHDTVEGLPSN